ncbi:MAG: phospho-N-acetylmuramoyl-pentapeptide-transferase [Clostridiales bacterium]|jgi:phospho-N-acetylmuramoyl-pentapeptide-transferase|nr:phospho-N-acetylmuramoyl-pentapeptide-transferase [Clostridiales bacterium]
MIGIWTVIAAVIGFGVTAILGKWFIPFLRKVKFGQTIREEGPKWHAKKDGTPTMGGIMFIIGIAVSLAVCLTVFYITQANSSSLGIAETTLMMVKVIGGFLMAVAFGAVGFIDDYIKVVKKRNLGLTAWQKLILQFVVAGAYLLSIFLAGGSSETIIPFVGLVDLGIAYWILAAILIVGMVNAVNFTDGIDGLNGSVSFFVCIFFMLIASFLSMGGMSILAVAAAGGCMGFLLWNFNPAKVFMGDTGSLFLGGMVCALAFGTNLPILLFPLGIIYIAEILSVVLQVTYFKLTHGKRLFKMSPIHHHFEMCGWGEMKICIVFSGVTILMGIGCVFLVLYGVVPYYG